MTKQILILFAACFTAFATYATAPTIISFSPASGPVGTLVTITGTNLSSPTAFTIGGVSAIVVSDDGTTLVGMVMPGAATGTVSVTTSGGTATGSGSYTVTPTLFPTGQQGPKLSGTGVGGSFAGQGFSVAISADGNTAIVGGYQDNAGIGAAWIYTRSGGFWTQQGPKLVGSGFPGTWNWQQGTSVALSADGNTALIGGVNGVSYKGAIWVYTRVGGIWTQQDSILVGSGDTIASVGNEYMPISLSADGNTAAVGGARNNNDTGAVWIYTRSAGTWSQQGPKLVGTGATGAALQGSSVALSADGNTVICGGPVDSNYIGASWIFTRSGTIWTQQGLKLIGSGSAGHASQGCAVSLSADGNTAMAGGSGDGSYTGAAWIFTRSAGIWVQQGNKLVGTGYVGRYVYQGSSLSLSADGNTAIIGGPADNSNTGAAWVFNRSGGIWAQQGNKLIGTGAVGIATQGIVALSADGSTAIMGGEDDNNVLGASWIFSSSCFFSSSADTLSICSNALPFSWNGLTFTRAGTQTAYLSTTEGCDSGAALTLTVRQVSHDTIPQSICSGDSFTFAGVVHYTGGYYSQTLTGSNNCDSIVTLHLTLTYIYDTLKHTICSGDSFSFAGIVHYASGYYSQTLTNRNGCDSIVTLHLTVNPPLVVTWVVTDTIWHFCTNGWYPGSPILNGGLPSGGHYIGSHVSHDTIPSSPFQSDSFVITYYYTDSNTCSNGVSHVFRSQVCNSLSEINDQSSIHLYPNPNTGTFTLQTSQMHNAAYTISDMLGQIIQHETITSDSQLIDIGAVPTGIYMLSITGTSEIAKFAVIR